MSGFDNVLVIDTTVNGSEANIGSYSLSISVNMVDFDFRVVDLPFTVDVNLNCPTATDGDMSRL